MRLRREIKACVRIGAVGVTLLVAIPVSSFGPTRTPDIRRRLLHPISNPSSTTVVPGRLTIEDVEDLTVPQLKEQLKEMGLKVGGRKADLIDRLLQSNGGDAEEAMGIEMHEEPESIHTDASQSTGVGEDVTSIATGIYWGGEDIPTYQDYKEELEALAFLSSIGDEEAASKAERVFDEMYVQFITEEDASLEPTTEIYNLLIEAFADSEPAVNSKGAERAERILERMVAGAASSDKSNDDEMDAYDGDTGPSMIPPPDINSYLAVIRGYASRAQPMAADAVFRSLYNSFMTTGDTSTMPNTDVYNQLIRAWMKSGLRTAPRVAQDLLNEMHDANDDNVMPNTETYARVITCVAQSEDEAAPGRVQSLIDEMNTMYQTGIETLKPTTAIYNAQIKAFGGKGVPEGGKRAMGIFQWMLAEYKSGLDPDMFPDRATFINVINVLTSSGGQGAPQKAEDLLDILQRLREQTGDDGLILNVRALNACIRCWARSREKGKAEKARQLLDRMIEVSKSSDKEEPEAEEGLLPNMQSYNGVLNACAYPSRGSTTEDKFAAFQIAVKTLNELRSSEECEPNHVSYGSFLRACGNLMPPSPKRDAVVANIFRKCLEEGKVSQFVLDTAMNVASEGLQTKLFDGSEDRLPPDWSRNV